MLTALVQAYRLLLSPLIGPRCRFLPTCSDYALDALAAHGAIRGGWLIVRRLVRCHPFGGSGFDPVPDVHLTADDKNGAASKSSASGDGVRSPAPGDMSPFGRSGPQPTP